MNLSKTDILYDLDFQMRLFRGADFPDAWQVGKPAPQIPYKWNSRISSYKWYNPPLPKGGTCFPLL